MHRLQALLILVVCTGCAAEFSGERALQYTRAIVAFGPRPPRSEAISKSRAYIKAQLKASGCQIVEDPFTASTPLGPIPMENIIARFPGTSGQAIAFTGHYDTKLMPGAGFVGANDGGSSTGLLLEMAHALARTPRKHDVYLVWFDGEEALVRWSDTDGLHGSRHLARRWQKDGTLARLQALINVDMIGDRDLGIVLETNSSSPLRSLIWRTAAELGYGRHFLSLPGAIEDDHMPFVRLGVNACDLIDFDYGPENSYWHTPADTIDKLSPASFAVVGRVLLGVLRRLESR
ncbi:MAG: M28 family peptidase [Acidobacteriia bacterium]|nr:M28 family peptidase [Terriglobia bacterium]